MRKKIICIVGATASGKTALSIELAKQINAEIISADSMQIYKKLNIGTAKVTKEEMEGIPHHMIDICDVRDGTHDSPKPKTEGHPLVTSKHIKNHKIDFSTANLISTEDFG